MALVACPDVRELERHLRAELGEAESAALEEHLSACARCAGSIAALSAVDMVGEALGLQSGLEPDAASEEALVNDLIERLGRQSPATGSSASVPLPPHLGRNLDRLGRFLAKVPSGQRALVEFRHPTWTETDEVFDVLERHLQAVFQSAA